MPSFDLDNVTSSYKTEFDRLSTTVRSLEDFAGSQLVQNIIDASVKVDKPHGELLNNGVFYIESSESLKTGVGVRKLNFVCYLAYMTKGDFEDDFQKINELLAKKLFSDENPRYILEDSGIVRDGEYPDKMAPEVEGNSFYVSRYNLSVMLYGYNR